MNRLASAEIHFTKQAIKEITAVLHTSLIPDFIQCCRRNHTEYD